MWQHVRPGISQLLSSMDFYSHKQKGKAQLAMLGSDKEQQYTHCSATLPKGES